MRRQAPAASRARRAFGDRAEPQPALLALRIRRAGLSRAAVRARAQGARCIADASSRRSSEQGRHACSASPISILAISFQHGRSARRRLCARAASRCAARSSMALRRRRRKCSACSRQSADAALRSPCRRTPIATLPGLDVPLAFDPAGARPLLDRFGYRDRTETDCASRPDRRTADRSTIASTPEDRARDRPGAQDDLLARSALRADIRRSSLALALCGDARSRSVHALRVLTLGVAGETLFTGGAVRERGPTTFVVESLPRESPLAAAGVVPSDRLRFATPLGRWRNFDGREHVALTILHDGASRAIDVEAPPAAHLPRHADVQLRRRHRRQSRLAAAGCAHRWRRPRSAALRALVASGVLIGWVYPYSATRMALHGEWLDFIASVSIDLASRALVLFALKYPDDKPVAPARRFKAVLPVDPRAARRRRAPVLRTAVPAFLRPAALQQGRRSRRSAPSSACCIPCCRCIETGCDARRCCDRSRHRVVSQPSSGPATRPATASSRALRRAIPSARRGARRDGRRRVADGRARGRRRARLGRADRRRSDPRVEKVCIWTPDKDLAQCVRGDRVVQVDRRGEEVRDADGVRAKFGVAPELIPDCLALVGDAADGYPGIPGIGAVTAARLVNRYGALEAFPPTCSASSRDARAAVQGSRHAADRRAAVRRRRRAAVARPDVPLRGVGPTRHRRAAARARAAREVARERHAGESCGAARRPDSCGRRSARRRACACRPLRRRRHVARRHLGAAAEEVLLHLLGELLARARIGEVQPILVDEHRLVLSHCAHASFETFS